MVAGRATGQRALLVLVSIIPMPDVEGTADHMGADAKSNRVLTAGLRDELAQTENQPQFSAFVPAL